MEVQIYESRQALAEALAEQFSEWAREGSLEHIALSGGSTPGLWYDVLAEDYWYRLFWRHIHYYWGDERCVPPKDPESNFGMAWDRLFSQLPVPEGHIHRMRGEDQPEDEAARYGELLREQLPNENGLPRFDLVVLGLGEDGHTASLFPDQMGLWNADAPCAVATHPDSGQQRITLTGQIINNAARVVILVSGSSKAEIVAEILGGAKPASRYPAARVDPTDGRLIWMLDADAAAELPQRLK